jgi:cyclitol reductase
MKTEKYYSARLNISNVSIKGKNIDEIYEADRKGDNTVIIVKIERMGICRADVKEIYAGRDIAKDRGPLFGHEFIGVIDFVGEETERLKKGKRVSFNPNYTNNRTTGFAEYFRIEGTKEVLENAIMDIPVDLCDEIAVFSEPFSCVSRSVDKLLTHMGIPKKDNEFLAGKKIAVIGAGNAGMFHVYLLQTFNAEVTIFNIKDGRIEFIKEKELFNGETVFFDKRKKIKENIREHKGKYDVVIVATTRITPKTLQLSSQLVANNGFIHIYGGTRKNQFFLKVNIDDIRRKERKVKSMSGDRNNFITGAYGTEPKDFQNTFEYFKNENISQKLKQMVSLIIPLKNLPYCINRMAEGKFDPPGKVIVLP